MKHFNPFWTAGIFCHCMKYRAKTNVISAVSFSVHCLFNTVGRDTYYFIFPHYLPGFFHGQVILPEMDAICIDSECNIRMVIYDKYSIKILL